MFQKLQRTGLNQQLLRVPLPAQIHPPGLHHPIRVSFRTLLHIPQTPRLVLQVQPSHNVKVMLPQRFPQLLLILRHDRLRTLLRVLLPLTTILPHHNLHLLPLPILHGGRALRRQHRVRNVLQLAQVPALLRYAQPKLEPLTQRDVVFLLRGRR
uniref:(northern house mosquito) hypothetical protein n=1 Tax=Culex pipiens TaxID=7175 RepID=A0A8D8IR75_CULPI